MAFEQIKYEIQDRVATITLNRPDRLNAWTRVMQPEIKAAFQQAADDDEVRVIVVTGEGRGFCAGADMQNLAAGAAAGARPASSFQELATDPSPSANFDQPLTYPLKNPKLTIAAINGPAAGIGLVFSLYCDIRLIASGAKITTAFAQTRTYRGIWQRMDVAETYRPDERARSAFERKDHFGRRSRRHGAWPSVAARRL